MSNIIKSQSAKHVDNASKTIQIRVIQTEKKTFEAREAALENSAVFFEKDRQKVLDEAHAQASSLLERAQAESEQIRRQVEQERQSWQEEKKQLREQAYQEGYEAGFQEGRKNGYSEYAERIATAVRTVDCSKEEYIRNVQHADQTILDIAIKSAEKIMNQVLEEQPERFFPVIKQALKDLYDQKEIQIHVHPVQYPMVVEQKEELEEMIPADAACYIYPNEEVGENGCYIETGQGRMDVGIDSQLHQLRAQLFDLLEGEED
ncbi:flagellar assembly protein FliH [Bacillus xiapuensis]|uniref:flagellar assembly protein FliH n=1 Tax=Bacillus xiapuensis TaxID=2014075 RepID=UPI0012FD2AA2|nr:flagellar assembly protein FliH [Bacillus xiapuensis]